MTTSAPEEPPAPAVTGARNESSVLFSLSALTASSPGNPSPGAASPIMAGRATKEDSGLIDLKALAASGEQQSSPLAMPAPLLGLAAPLGLAPPLGGGVESSVYIPEPPPKSKAGMFVAIAVVLAGAAVVITVAATSGSREPLPPPTPSVVIVERTVTRPAEAKPPPTGDLDETKDAGAKKKVGKWRGPAKQAWRRRQRGPRRRVDARPGEAHRLPAGRSGLRHPPTRQVSYSATGAGMPRLTRPRGASRSNTTPRRSLIPRRTTPSDRTRANGARAAGEVSPSGTT